MNEEKEEQAKKDQGSRFHKTEERRGDKITLTLLEGEKEYLEEVSRDLGVSIPKVIHFMVYMYKRVEGALRELFQPRREAVEKFLRIGEGDS